VSSRSVVIRSTEEGYVVVDEHTNAIIAGPLESLQIALAAAAQYGATRVLHQAFDNRGRPLSEARPLNFPAPDSGEGSTA
jgi:hypothetical protein